MIVSDEIGRSKPSSLFFLSKFGCLLEKVFFYSEVTKNDMWNSVDILLTANPDLLLNKPSNKIVIKYETEFNEYVESEHTIKSLSEFEDNSFDVVILSKTIQSMHNTVEIINEMLRVGKQVIVTFPNFGYWKNRLQSIQGVMPKSKELPYSWFNTPNVHLCTIKDFDNLCKSNKYKIVAFTHPVVDYNNLGKLVDFTNQQLKNY